jgi:glycosyltransferase 2 family protein
MASTSNARPSILRSRILHLSLAAILAGVLLYYSLRGIDWSQVWLTLSHAELKYIALWLAIVIVNLFLRALRWRVLLTAEGPVPISTAFWATSAGYFGNSFLPARAGELVRTLMISSRTGMSRSFVLTTALSERIFDAITLIGIAAIVLLTLPIKPGWFSHAATPFSIIGLGGVLAIALLPKLEPLWASLLRKLPVPASLTEKLIRIMEQVLVGIRSFHDGKRLGVFLVFTCVIWFCDSVTAVVGMYALGMTISFAVAFLLLTGLALSSALPSTPGYVGIYQFVAVSVLVPFGFTQPQAVAYIMMYQGLLFANNAFWGSLALTRNKGVSLFATAPVVERP